MPMLDEGWIEDSGLWRYCYFVNEFYKTADKDKDFNNMKKHIFLEFLAYLDVIQYERGYDGVYYDIFIKVRDK